MSALKMVANGMPAHEAYMANAGCGTWKNFRRAAKAQEEAAEAADASEEDEPPPQTAARPAAAGGSDCTSCLRVASGGVSQVATGSAVASVVAAAALVAAAVAAAVVAAAALVAVAVAAAVLRWPQPWRQPWLSQPSQRLGCCRVIQCRVKAEAASVCTDCLYTVQIPLLCLSICAEDGACDVTLTRPMSNYKIRCTCQVLQTARGRS